MKAVLMLFIYSRGHNQRRRNNQSPRGKIPRHDLRPQAKLEGPRCDEEEANRAQSKRIILAFLILILCFRAP